MQPLLQLIRWENELIETLENELQICRSDAQGLMEAQPQLIREAWQEKLSAYDAAMRIINLNPQETPHND